MKVKEHVEYANQSATEHQKGSRTVSAPIYSLSTTIIRIPLVTQPIDSSIFHKLDHLDVMITNSILGCAPSSRVTRSYWFMYDL